ncbi:MAG: vraR 1 [Firmicutes bacterium]|nr:vraR 1 [Bacillota bacterium]
MQNNRILLLDDNLISLKSIKKELSQKFQIIITDRPKDALQYLTESSPFAAIVAEYLLPEMNGIQFFYLSQKIALWSQRIMLTSYPDNSIVIDAVNKGKIHSFLRKPCSPSILTDTLTSAVTYYNLLASLKSDLSLDSNHFQGFSQSSDTFENHKKLNELTNREWEILDMIAMGYSNQDIAFKLCLTIGTIKSHCCNIFNKLGVSSRTKAVALLHTGPFMSSEY